MTFDRCPHNVGSPRVLGTLSTDLSYPRGLIEICGTCGTFGVLHVTMFSCEMRGYSQSYGMCPTPSCPHDDRTLSYRRMIGNERL